MITSIITKQTPPTPLALPEGYDLTPPDAPAVLGITIPGQQLYGGADISRASDANGVLHIGCCARGPDGDFRFRVFRYVGAVAVEVPLQARVSGRGEIAIDQYSGEMTWIAWEFSTFYTGTVPGAAPFAFAAAEPGYTVCQPSRYSAAIDGQPISGGRSIDMAALFDLPADARAYAVRFVVSAAAPNVRGRLGVETQPGQLTVNCQVAGLELHQVGIVNAGPGGRVWLSVVDASGQAASARVWLQVVGYWP